jgi:hypothetical protein
MCLTRDIVGTYQTNRDRMSRFNSFKAAHVGIHSKATRHSKHTLYIHPQNSNKKPLFFPRSKIVYIQKKQNNDLLPEASRALSVRVRIIKLTPLERA